MTYETDSKGRYVLEGRTRRRIYRVSDLGALPIDKITKADIVRWYNALRKTHGRRTCQLALGTLSSMLGFAVEHEIIESNPAKGVGGRRVQRRTAKRVKPDRVVDPEQIELGRRYFLLRGRIADWLMMALLAYLGLRPGEAVALVWLDLIDESGKAREAIQLERSQSGGIEVDGTKTGDWRVVQVFEPLRRDIEWAYAQLGSPPLDSHVCLSTTGALVISKRWSYLLHWIWKRLGLPPHCAYDLRHSAASYLGSGGDEEKGKAWSFTEIGVQLGHSPETCARIYQHVVNFKKYRGLTIEALILRAKAAAAARLIGLDANHDPIFGD
jgi:integrase